MQQECNYLAECIQQNVADMKLEQITIVDSILRNMPSLKSSVSQAVRGVLPNIIHSINTNPKALSLNGLLSLLTYLVRTEVHIPDKNELIEIILKNLCNLPCDNDVQKVSRMYKTLELVARLSSKREITEQISRIVQLSTASFIAKINDLSLVDIVSLLSLYNDSKDIVQDSDLLWTLCERITDRCFAADNKKDVSKIINIFAQLGDLVCEIAFRTAHGILFRIIFIENSRENSKIKLSKKF